MEPSQILEWTQWVPKIEPTVNAKLDLLADEQVDCELVPDVLIRHANLKGQTKRTRCQRTHVHSRINDQTGMRLVKEMSKCIKSVNQSSIRTWDCVRRRQSRAWGREARRKARRRRGPRRETCEARGRTRQTNTVLESRHRKHSESEVMNRNVPKSTKREDIGKRGREASSPFPCTAV